MLGGGIIILCEYYRKYLSTINSIDFTRREVDILACLINAKRTSSIASLLSISPRTVTTHLRNIMLKIECNSQDGVIQFLERSSELPFLREYYCHLKNEAQYEKCLSELSKLDWQLAVGKFVLLVDSETLKQFLLKRLREDFEKVGLRSRVENDCLHLSSHRDSDRQATVRVLTCQKDASANEVIDESHTEVMDMRGKNYFESVSAIINHISKASKVNKTWERFFTELATINSFPAQHQNAKEETPPDPKPYLKITKRIGKYGVLPVISLSALALYVTPDLNISSLTTASQHTLNSNTKPHWNIPHLQNHYTQRTDLENMVWDKYLQDTDGSASRIVSLQGLGGAGKTTLAKYIITNPRKSYDFRAWFKAETPELLKAEYLLLGEKEGLFPSKVTDTTKINIVKTWLENRENIFLVYDNVEDFSTIQEYIPSKGHILITSRNYKVPDPIEMMKMSETEALSLLNTIMKKSGVGLSGDYPKELVKTLGYLPLAITQAGFYILENKISIEKFLSLYETNQFELLNGESLPPGETREPVFVTWNMSLEKIKDHPYGKDAAELLNFISCCYSEEVPKQLLMEYLYSGVDEVAINQVINLLRKYSLVSISNGKVSIHRLLHNWLQSSHSSTEKCRYVAQGVEALKRLYPWHNKSSEEITLVRSLTPHSEALFSAINLVDDPDTESELLSVLGDSHDTLGNYRRANYYYDQALELNKDLYGSENVHSAKAMRNLASIKLIIGEPDAGLKLSRDALRIIEQQYGINHKKTFGYLYNVGLAYLRSGHHIKSTEYFNKALRVFSANFEPDHPAQINVLRSLGWAKYRLGNYKQALENYKQAINIFTIQLGENSPELARMYKEIGWIYIFLGDYESAEKVLEKALKLTEVYLPNNHIDLAKVRNAIARLALHLGQYSKAKEFYIDTFAIEERFYGKDHPYILFAKLNKDLCEVLSGEHENAENNLKHLLSVKREKDSLDSIGQAEILNALAMNYFFTQHYHEAEELLQEAITLTKNADDYNSTFQVTLVANLANVYRLLGKLEESQDLLYSSLKDVTNLYGPESVNVAIVMGNLGLLHSQLNENEKSADYINKALNNFRKHLPKTHHYIVALENELSFLDLWALNPFEQEVNSGLFMF